MSRGQNRVPRRGGESVPISKNDGVAHRACSSSFSVPAEQPPGRCVLAFPPQLGALVSHPLFKREAALESAGLSGPVTFCQLLSTLNCEAVLALGRDTCDC